MRAFTTALALAAGIAASAAHGATLSVVGGHMITLPTNYSLSGPVYDSLSGGVGDIGDLITVFTSSTKTAANGLALDMPANLTFTYLGSEAGFTNTFQAMGMEFANNKVSAVGETSGLLASPAGLVNFRFSQSNALFASNTGTFDFGLRVAFSEVFNGGQSILAFFDDRTTNIDYDDLVVRIDIAPIPLPPSALLLLSSVIGVMFVMRHRRHA